MRNLFVAVVVAACAAVAEGSVNGSVNCTTLEGGVFTTITGTTSCHSGGTSTGANVNGDVTSPVSGLLFVSAHATSQLGESRLAMADADIAVTDTVRFFGADSVLIKFDDGFQPNPGSGFGFASLNGNTNFIFGLQSIDRSAVNLVLRVQADAETQAGDNEFTGVIVNYSILEIRGRDPGMNPVPFVFASAGGFTYPLVNGTQIPWSDAFYATPEPSSITLTGLGILLLGLARRCQRAFDGHQHIVGFIPA